MMRFLKVSFVALVALLSLAASCHPQPPVPPDPPAPPDPTVVIIDTVDDIPAAGATLTFKMVTSEGWSAKVQSGCDWCVLDNTFGEAGDVVIAMTVAPNYAYESRKCEIMIKMGDTEGKVVVTQLAKEHLDVSPQEFIAECTGGELVPAIVSNVEYSVEVSEDWVVWEEGVITVAENPDHSPREATVSFNGGGLTAVITISQKPQPLPVDEVDGVVTVLQTHTEGEGIPLVFMGDAFSKKQIEEGEYVALMQNASDAFFAVEPYTTFRQLFDVYTVNVVSNYYQDFTVPGSTTLGTYFGSGTYVGGDLDKCREYLLRAIDESSLDNALAVVLLNREYHAGRSYLTFVKYDTGDEPAGGESAGDDCARGVAYAFVARGLGEDDFVKLIQHEAGGHGFGKLADEYFYEGMGTISDYEVENYRSIQTLHHAYMNVDFSSDAESVRWSHFLTDERYQYDNLGVFEGACFYPLGAYRSSENSIMNGNADSFNAPSREAIYYRIHKLAYGAGWKYDFEEFAAYDAINRLPGQQ